MLDFPTYMVLRGGPKSSKIFVFDNGAGEFTIPFFSSISSCARFIREFEIDILSPSIIDTPSVMCDILNMITIVSNCSWIMIDPSPSGIGDKRPMHQILNWVSKIDKKHKKKS